MERDMNVHTQISDYMAAQPERKRRDMQALHDIILGLMPDCRLWFLSINVDILEAAMRDGIEQTST